MLDTADHSFLFEILLPLASWWRGLVSVFWRMRLDLVFLVGRTMSGGVFWGVCDLIMILGSLSANGWGCGKRGLLFVAVRRLLIVVACFVAEHGL